MEPKMTRTSEAQVQLYDEEGRLIGTIVRPVVPEVVGPRAEKVYLERHASRLTASTQHAA